MSRQFASRHVVLASLIFGVVASSYSWAQDQQQPRRRGLFGTSRVSLATLEPVQEALQLTDEQKQLADTLHDDLMEDRRDVFQSGGGDFEAMRKELEELDGEATAKLTEKLDDTQNDRITGIYIQANGPNALGDKAVMEKLQLTEQQRSDLEEAQQENRRSFFDAFQAGMSDDERRDAMNKLRQEGDDRLMAVLTDEQRTEFKKLEGEEVDYDLSQLRGGFGGGGGGRRGGGGGDSDRPQRPQ